MPLESAQQEWTCSNTYFKHIVDIARWSDELKKVTKMQRFAAVWNEHTNTVWVQLTTTGLAYISSAVKPLSSNKCAAVLRMVEISLADHYQEAGTNPCFDKDVLLNLAPISTPRQAISMKNAEEPDSLQPMRIGLVPVEILTEAFSFLDIFTQLTCRRVCRCWNSVLLSPTAFSTVTINVRRCDNQQLAMVLHKKVTNFTKTVLIVNDGHPQPTATRAPLQILTEMLTAKKVKVPVIIVCRLGMSARSLLDYSDPVRLQWRSEWSRVCAKLVLKQVSVRELMEAQNPEAEPGKYTVGASGHEALTLEMVTTVIVTTGVHIGFLLDKLEEACPKVPPKLYWKAVWHLKKERETGDLIPWQVVRKWQAGDRRFEDNCGRQNFELEVRSLRRLTIYALHYASR
ncbi:uncharacterized protein LOC129583839 [Paramacrobiotus metropolitanus]|uniref:uncharacterized protein LOC129583839 n=1 Tax=Paramacrobiotus metropolitanus TaxID=2943436 RepID=UPI0024458110|nr:uncharacterized protein LOC129583839 [Paramacrobiotus metropolitanus]